MRQVIVCLCRYALLLTIGFTTGSCQSKLAVSSNPNPGSETANPFQPVVVDPQKVVMGQTVYVPVYSHVYQLNDRNPVMNLSATLSLRNTDLDHSLFITSVRYNNNTGELVKTYLETPIELPRLASADYLIESNDTSGGFGANFIVEWVAQTTVTEPVIEALMINTAGNQGISFISQGRVIKQQAPPTPNLASPEAAPP